MESQNANNNLRLWNKVEQTDPDFTKAYKGKGGFEGDAINAMYLVKKATNLWGPIGDRWGYEIEEERYDQGAPIGVYPNTSEVIYAVVHTLKLRLWYKTDDGELATVQHYGHTDFVSANKYGAVTDSEAPKKSLTDALKKCLSMIGFSADVFMGMFDNQAYVEEAANKAALEKAEDKIEEESRQAAEFRKAVETAARLLQTATSLHELGTLFKEYARKFSLRNDKRVIAHITKIYEARKAELEPKP
jgi:hypothetical protein